MWFIFDAQWIINLGKWVLSVLLWPSVGGCEALWDTGQISCLYHDAILKEKKTPPRWDNERFPGWNSTRYSSTTPHSSAVTSQWKTLLYKSDSCGIISPFLWSEQVMSIEREKGGGGEIICKTSNICNAQVCAIWIGIQTIKTSQQSENEHTTNVIVNDSKIAS